MTTVENENSLLIWRAKFSL